MNDETKLQTEDEQKLHLVFGGNLTSLQDIRFQDVSKLDVVGIFPDYDAAYNAWKEAAQHTVDDAHMRYFVVELTKLMDPSK